ncbi:MAG: menaquinone biosynthesis protein [Planctomycetaceae bacterium]|jgi:chorismate dehydratase|nr:menaquinone biosynthesis protein [Planctomycetaceae bacterium]
MFLSLRGGFKELAMRDGLGIVGVESERLISPLRVGAFQHLRCNSWPLVHFLHRELPDAVISDWQPSAVRLRLMTRHIDLALLPSAELMNLSRGKIVSDCCIACKGVVRSVRLISKKPIEAIGTLALDVSSRSSVLMCEILLLHYFGLRPLLYRLDAKCSFDSCRADAFVVVGDAALAYRPSQHWTYQYDLGSLWFEKTGLPFVFATWASCDKNVWATLEYCRACKKARDHAAKNIDELLNEKYNANANLLLPRELVQSYLTESIIYKLGNEERSGLQLFFDLALRHGFTKHRTVVEIIDDDEI